jgi:MFS family permease
MKKTLPRTVIILGLVSFLNDIASEMVIPLIPILLATVLSGGPVALGIIEGVADALASFLKLWSGRHSDRLGGRRKGLALLGYFVSNCARPLLALATNWLGVLLLRSIDRVGKGVRSAPRDALVADTTPPAIWGYAYGYHRALDNAGAVGGSLIAAAVLAWSTVSLSQVILWSALPGLAAVMLLAFGVKEPVKPVTAVPTPPAPLQWSLLSVPLRRYLVVLTFFTLGRVSETFIVLRGHELGLSIVHLLLLWAAFNLAKALTATWGGRYADRMGRTKLLLMSWSIFTLSFLALGQVTQVYALWTVVIIYGAFTGLSEGTERAQISDFADAAERGTAFGWYYLMVGLAAIPGGVLFGGAWHYFGPAAAFTFAAAVTAMSVYLLQFWAQQPAMVKSEG